MIWYFYITGDGKNFYAISENKTVRLQLDSTSYDVAIQEAIQKLKLFAPEFDWVNRTA